MKGVLKRDFFREIKKGVGRFIALFAIVALGVGFFAGVSATSPDMRLTADGYFDEQGLFDLHVLSPVGLNDEDIAAVGNTEGVEKVEPGYSADMLVLRNESEVPVKILSYAENDTINRPVLREGRMPTAPNECVIDEQSSLSDSGFQIGDEIILSDHSKKATADLFAEKRFTIVGLVSSPLYVSFERGSTSIGSGNLDLFMLVPESAFSSKYYTDLYLTAKGAAEKNAFHQDYTDLIDRLQKSLEDVGKGRGEIRYEELYAEAASKLADGEAELAKAETEGNQKLSDARKVLDHARIKIADGQKAIKAAEATLGQKETEIAAAEKSFAAVKAEKEPQLNAAEAELEQSKKVLNETRATLDKSAADLKALEEQITALEASGQIEAAASLRAVYTQNQAALTAGEDEYAKGLSAYESGLSALEKGKEELRTAGNQLAEGRKQLEEGKRALTSKKAELAQAKSELAKGEREYAQNYLQFDDEITKARAEVENGRRDLQNFSVPSWYVLDRNTNYGFVGLSQDIDRVAAVAAIFPIFFFLVAALVCLTTMTRMVDEKRTEIGTLKALGYSKGVIASKFLGYAVISTVFGSLLGLLIGFRLFPSVIWSAYQIMYAYMPDAVTPFHLPYAIGATTAALLVTCLSTLFACIATLREAPASLMRPRPPRSGKRVFLERISPLWKRLSFTQKVTVRNLMRYKKRFLMTVIGIGGCMALMVTGFGLKQSISDIVVKQFDEIVHYQMTSKISDNTAPKEAKAVLAADRRVADSLLFDQKSIEISTDSGKADIQVFVPENPSRLNEFISLRERKGHRSLTLDESGIILTEKGAELLGVKVGDALTFTLNDHELTLPISGIAENYVYHYLYLSPEVYTRETGETLSMTGAASKISDTSTEGRSAISADLLESGKFASVEVTSAIRDTFNDMIRSLDSVVLILILSAAALSFIVLYNLSGINITERIREIATIKVLGFYDKEVSSYVNRENILLTLIGILVGIVMGFALHKFVILKAEMDIVMFGRSLTFPSFLFAGILTFLFSLFVNFVLHFRLKRVNMVESLKSVE